MRLLHPVHKSETANRDIHCRTIIRAVNLFETVGQVAFQLPIGGIIWHDLTEPMKCSTGRKL